MEKIELIRLRSAFLALETLVISVLRGAARTTPTVAQYLQQLADQGAESAARVHLGPGAPELSDLYSGEYQEAWELLMQRVHTPGT